MCGICGIVWRDGTTAGELGSDVRRMAQSLHHRGPDDGAAWTDAEAGVAFGFRRLSIIDLSPAGRQPMISASGRTVLCYNGEIYNAGEIREELGVSTIPWRGHSDTEVLLEAIERWGVERATSRCIGMFAFAAYDVPSHRLWLVRDRMGIKPLYWARQRSMFLFASELRALRTHPAFEARMDRDATAAYLRLGYFPNPLTLIEDAHQLEPGHILSLEPGKEPVIRSYWSLFDCVRRARTHLTECDDTAAADQLETLIADSVRRRMIADVPLGAFLSGGYDSSLVVTMMQKQASRPVKTFTISLEDNAYDEAAAAQGVAAYLGTDHTELRIAAKEAQDVITRLPDIFDEPFADSSQIPTYLVSELARRHVTVALSGDGGDELFAGYNRYAHARLLGGVLAFVPAPVRRACGRVLTTLSPGTWDGALRLVPGRYLPRHAGDNLHKVAEVLTRDAQAYYSTIMSAWHDPGQIMHGTVEPVSAATDRSAEALLSDPVARMQYRDTMSYLPDDILTKVDRASMAVSLEARVPLLDHRIVEFAWSLPIDKKIRGRSTKRILRQVLYRHVPPELVDRPKTGFSIPIAEWLRGPLRPWAEDLLSEQALRGIATIDPAPVRKRWHEHLAGQRNWARALWCVLMLQANLRRWGAPP